MGDATPGPIRVPIIDDSNTIRRSAEMFLRQKSNEIALAVSDDRAGLDLARSLRGDARTRQVPIIIISSRTAEKRRSQAAQLGVNAFLGKPYPEVELPQHIAALITAHQDVAVAV